ncbi:MAG TPA: ABC transporter permease [Devosia sp.]|jgi:NitT/TauT family transport system permease protein|nr:ABC transporter permease [Devosia sp.]
MIGLFRLLFLIVLVGLWYAASQYVGRSAIPTPLATWEASQRLIAEGRLVGALGQSLTVYLSGFGLAVLVAIPVGVAMGAIRPLGRTLDIFVNALAATPRVAFIPLIIVLLGLGLQAKLFVVFLGAVMPILLNTYAGVLAVDGELTEMARAVGAPRRRIFWRITLPGSLPFIVVGLRIGATIGLINTVVAELYTAVSGLGGMLAIYGNTFRMAEYFVVVITLSLIGVVVTEALRLLENRLTRWRVVD